MGVQANQAQGRAPRRDESRRGSRRRPAGAGRLLAEVAPWGVSAALHAGLAVAAALVYVTVAPGSDRELVAAGAMFSSGPTERIAMSPQERAGAAAMVSGQSEPTDPLDSPHQSVHRGTPSRARPLVGLNCTQGAAAPGLGLAAFSAAPRSSLWGAGASARHVVYVIDRSGSMIDTFEEVRRAVLLSIGRLGEDQDFHVILFAQNRAIELAPRRLVPPMEAHKAQAAEFLAAARAGFQSDPIPAISRAFDVLAEAGDGGKLIYLLTDGVFPNGPAVLSAIRARNKDKSVRICTYLCGGDNPAAKELLQDIARANGGLFRQVGGPAETP